MAGVHARLYKPRFVYFVEDTTNGLYKVGSTAQDPLVRLAQLRATNPERNLRLAAVCRGSWLHEREFHQQFRQHCRWKREWYARFDELVSFLDTLPSGADHAEGYDIPTLAPVQDSMVLMRDRGYTYEQIGDFYGISKQAVNENVIGRSPLKIKPGGARPRLLDPPIEQFYIENCADTSVLTLEA